ncbi:SPOR domain-containing protein [Qipengyuania sp. 6B39]|uniref:SPOR domain-containing protein n=1 Tax=Qipengyuania proteolytica TaxID=2867239 RepID=UPI001C895ADC|nr:SPOR domain-containing protein [Qipengyuania proteolytica]MBX7496108.1 SPOR domain-containing protein [Qipengyuania proteolytica]
MRVGAAALAGVLLLGACASQARDATAQAPLDPYGPAGDYPVVLGEPFVIDGETFTPFDVMNYDRVGYLAEDDGTAAGITGAHKTLPLPSYVEVTSLETGRTILVRLERRGPMTSDRLIALSPEALAQLGEGEGAAIRMRRVNPPEEHRAKLRAGEQAPLRMDTPQGLLEVLKRKLPEAGSVSLGDPRQATVSGQIPTASVIASIDPSQDLPVGDVAQDEEAPVPTPVEPAASAEPAASPAETAESQVESGETPTATPPADQGRFTVQLGAFSVEANAAALARRVDGFVVSAGKFSLVRVGPYSSRGQAAEALAKLRAQGYSDALIKTTD